MENNSKLKLTGERLMPEIYEYWSIEHLHRYALTFNLIIKKKVLDIASGEGYGTHLMAEYAQHIIGVDISEDAIKHSNLKYKKDNLSYLHGSTSAIPIKDHSIDVVTSFETIEHHDEHEKMMQEIKRVLVPGGILIISSPDKKYYSDMPNYKNPFHVKELYADEFYELLRSHFKNIIPLNQKTVFGSFICTLNPSNKKFVEFSGDYKNIETNDAIKSPLYNICIASDNPIISDSLIEYSTFCNQNIFELYTNLKIENEKLKNLNDIFMKKLQRPAQKVVNFIEFPFKKIKQALKK